VQQQLGSVGCNAKASLVVLDQGVDSGDQTQPWRHHVAARCLYAGASHMQVSHHS
jgi:hypothetical protein